MTIGLPLIVFAGLLLIPSVALCADKNNPWTTLKNVTRRRTYGFVGRNYGCISGQIVSVREETVVVKRPNAGTVTINRTDLLRVSDGPKPFDVIYSARSSWADVASVPSNSREQVKVFTRAGQRYEGKFVKANDAAITLFQSGRNLSIPKDDIAQVFYVREKPLSDSAMDAANVLAQREMEKRRSPLM